jgi:hypothetical protein
MRVLPLLALLVASGWTVQLDPSEDSSVAPEIESLELVSTLEGVGGQEDCGDDLGDSLSGTVKKPCKKKSAGEKLVASAIEHTQNLFVSGKKGMITGTPSSAAVHTSQILNSILPRPRGVKTSVTTTLHRTEQLVKDVAQGKGKDLPGCKCTCATDKASWAVKCKWMGKCNKCSACKGGASASAIAGKVSNPATAAKKSLQAKSLSPGGSGKKRIVKKKLKKIKHAEKSVQKARALRKVARATLRKEGKPIPAVLQKGGAMKKGMAKLKKKEKKNVKKLIKTTGGRFPRAKPSLVVRCRQQ